VRRALAAALAALALACAGALERRPPEKQRFVFAPPPPHSGPVAGAGVLRVGRVRISPLFENMGFAYRVGNDRYESDFYNEFFAPPSQMLRETLVDWLGDARLFVSVGIGAAPPPDWLLEADVRSLYGDRRDPQTPQAVLAAVFRLLDARGSQLQLVLERSYDEREPATDGSPRALVDAWNRALGRVLVALEGDLRAALEARPRPGAAR
jgi:cholesterol transport system auxiliary component